MRGKTPKRELLPDPKFNSQNIAKLVNHIMDGGKKSIAQKIVYNCFDIIAEKTKKDPLVIFDEALKNVSPDVEVKSRRIGGGNYQIPTPVMGNRRTTLAYRWIVGAAKNKKGAPMSQKLAEELIAAAEKEGSAMKKKMDTYKMAEANRAFAHFARNRR